MNKGRGEQRREAELNGIDDKYRNWYEVFVYSYFDSDGDMIGDLGGLAEKLDYISGLGMDGIWLMPIVPSPSYHKYDVTDYYSIDPQYGTLEDFSALLEKAHALGIDVIIDLVLNHTSNEHPWFLSARSGEDSEYRNWYNWSDSPQDGYALHSADTAGASRETPVTLPVVMKLYAGDAPAAALPAGCAARIMTGAPLPEGADCVLMQELTDSGEETVQLYAAVKPLQNVVFRGEDVAAGAVIAPAGTVLTPAHLGVLAGQGYAEVAVCRPLTVGILSTGSELLEPGAPWAPGKIYVAIGIQNAARLRQLGFAVERQQCSDDPEVITGKMQELLTRCDAVITSGGVSVGQKDYLPLVLEKLGAQLVAEGVAQKPGSPMLAATLGGKLVFCLSGNPLAAAATLEQYAIPALLRAAGRREESCIPARTGCTLTNGFSKASKGNRYLRATACGGKVTLPGAGNTEAPSSGALSAMMGCNCLVELPAGSGPVEPGTEVEVLCFVQ